MNDKDIITFGKHKGTAMANVPASWLIWFFEDFQSKPNIKMSDDADQVIKYIWNTGIDLLRKESRNER